MEPSRLVNNVLNTLLTDDLVGVTRDIAENRKMARRLLSGANKGLRPENTVSWEDAIYGLWDVLGVCSQCLQEFDDGSVVDGKCKQCSGVDYFRGIVSYFVELNGISEGRRMDIIRILRDTGYSEDAAVEIYNLMLRQFTYSQMRIWYISSHGENGDKAFVRRKLEDVGFTRVEMILDRWDRERRIEFVGMRFRIGDYYNPIADAVAELKDIVGSQKEAELIVNFWRNGSYPAL